MIVGILDKDNAENWNKDEFNGFIKYPNFIVADPDDNQRPLLQQAPYNPLNKESYLSKFEVGMTADGKQCLNS